jgi:hypothetical protein
MNSCFVNAENSSIFFPFKFLVKLLIYMCNGFPAKQGVSEVSKREDWCDIRYIPFLPVGERHFEIGVHYGKDTDRKCSHVQERGFKYTPHISISDFPQAC